MKKICKGSGFQTTLNILASLPTGYTTVLLLRHSTRHELPLDAPGDDIPLTDSGRAMAVAFGARIEDRLKSLHSSPVARCMETAAMIRNGSKQAMDIIPDTRLGNPGIFITDPELAWNNWLKLGNHGVIEKILTGTETLPGMAESKSAARMLVLSALAKVKNNAGVHIFVTHDVILAATVSGILGRHYGQPNSPKYLEGAFFLRVDDSRIRCLFRDKDELIPEHM